MSAQLPENAMLENAKLDTNTKVQITLVLNATTIVKQMNVLRPAAVKKINAKMVTLIRTEKVAQ